MYCVQGPNTQVEYRRGLQVGVTLFHHSDWMRDRHVTGSHHRPQLVLLVMLEPCHGLLRALTLCARFKSANFMGCSSLS